MKEEYSKKIRRWYDNDPVLSKSMKILENSDDETQIKLAMNLIKVIIEHNIADNNYIEVDDILTAVEDGRMTEKNNRWYDIDATLRTAINMLAASPTQTQKAVAKEMANMIINKIKCSEDDIISDNDDDDEEEDN